MVSSSPDRDGRPDPGAAGTAAEYVDALRRLKSWSGMGFRQLEKRAAQLGLALPRSTITAALNRDVLPREDLAVALVRTCGGDQEEASRWVAARRRIAAATSSPADTAAEDMVPGLDPHPSPTSGDGWHTARFAVLVRLDTQVVETYQDWRIIADRDGLDQITPGVTPRGLPPSLPFQARR